jgi:hypothetical protein
LTRTAGLGADRALSGFEEERGFGHNETDHLVPDYSRVLGHERSEIIAIADSILGLLSSRQQRDPEMRLKVALSYVQGLNPRKVGQIVDGRFVGGWLPPAIVVYRRGGDCDSKALLFVAIWQTWYQAESNRLPLLVMQVHNEGHLVVGVPVAPPQYLRTRETRIPTSPFEYTVCETTIPEPPGILPRAIDSVWVATGSPERRNFFFVRSE